MALISSHESIMYMRESREKTFTLAFAVVLVIQVIRALRVSQHVEVPERHTENKPM